MLANSDVPVHICIADSVMHIVALASFEQVHIQSGINNKFLSQ